MFTWPTPREYYSDYAERKKSKILIPSDMTRDVLLNRFRKVMQAAGHWPKVTNVLIALEPHQRFRPDGSGRELHYHIAFKLSEDFAHRHIEVLFKLEGIHGFISKTLKGWMAYADYLLCETPRKPAHCRDASPLLCPRGGTEAVDHLRGLCLAARQRIFTLTEAVTGWKRKVAKRRRTLEWSEVISLVVENKIGDEATWWKVAKKQQTDQGATMSTDSEASRVVCKRASVTHGGIIGPSTEKQSPPRRAFTPQPGIPSRVSYCQRRCMSGLERDTSQRLWCWRVQAASGKHSSQWRFCCRCGPRSSSSTITSKSISATGQGSKECSLMTSA